MRLGLTLLLAPLLALPLAAGAAQAKAPKAAEETTHTVKAGETLAGIANRAVVPRVLIIEANGLKKPYTVHKGQKLIIPRRREHVVEEGETGFGIAYDYGVPWKAIAGASGIDPKKLLKAGTRLTIPTMGAAAAPPAKSAEPTPTPSQAASDPGDHPSFAWPAPGAIRRSFSPPGRRAAHPAIDIVGEVGDAVRASAKGKVVFAGEEPKKYGNLVVIAHGKGWFSAYAKLQKVTVKKGERVKAGERVGLLGNSGETANTELHFEIRHDNVPVDPASVLPARE